MHACAPSRCTSHQAVADVACGGWQPWRAPAARASCKPIGLLWPAGDWVSASNLATLHGRMSRCHLRWVRTRPAVWMHIPAHKARSHAGR